MKMLSMLLARGAVRRRGPVLLAVLWLTLAVATAVVRRGSGADAVVIHTLGAFVVPLASFAITGAVLGGGSLADAVSWLVRFGAARRSASLAPFVTCGAAAATLMAAVALAVVFVARPPGAPLGDGPTTAWIAALGAAAYVSLFLAGASFGRRGGGRLVVLVVDALVGQSTGIAGAFTVRANLRNLLGGTSPLSLSQRTSSVLLIALVLAGVAIASLRLRPTLARAQSTRFH